MKAVGLLIISFVLLGIGGEIDGTFGVVVSASGVVCMLLAGIAAIMALRRGKGLPTSTTLPDLSELIENWSISILKAPLIVWTQDDLMSQSDNATRVSKEIYATAGMVYLAEHMVSQNIKSKAKIDNFANKLIDQVADSFAEQMLNDNATRADKAEFSNMVKKGYFYYWTRKEAADNTPKGTTDMVIDKLHELDGSLGKNELAERLRDYLVGQRFGDFADIASHILDRLNTGKDE